MLSDLIQVSDTLTRVHYSYNALQSLIGGFENSGVVMDCSGLAFLLGSVNEQLQTVINDIDEGRKANIAQ